MITAALLYLLYAFIVLLTAPLRFLPDVGLPAVVVNTISSVSGYLASGWTWLPITLTTLLATWGVYLTIEAAIFLYKGFMWVLKKIPGIS